jgi:CheY-like chemotaxis protein
VPTILVADDNSNIQKMVALALQEHGIKVVAVGNGEAAVRKLAETNPDVVLADVFMPVRNGYEVCDYIKREPRFAHIPVVLLIGAFDPLDEKEAHRVGANGVLKKPFVPPDPLIAMVTGFLAGIEKQHAAPEPVPEPQQAAPPPPRPAPEQEFPEPQPEEFTFTSGPLNLRDADSEAISTEEDKAAASAEEGSEARESASWKDPSETAETLNSPQATLDADSSAAWKESFSQWQAGNENLEISIPGGSAPAIPKPDEPARESALTIQDSADAPTEEITFPGHSITGEDPAASVSASALDDLAASPAEWMELMSGMPSISVPQEATESWEAAPAASSIPSSQTFSAKPPAEQHSEASGVIPFRSGAEQAPNQEADSESAPAQEAPRTQSSFTGGPSPYTPVDDQTELLPTQQTAPEGAEEREHLMALPGEHNAFAEAHFSGRGIESYPAPPSADPALVENIVSKVLERLEPQLHAILSHELVRPLVESLLQHELEKKEH